MQEKQILKKSKFNIRASSAKIITELAALPVHVINGNFGMGLSLVVVEQDF